MHDQDQEQYVDERDILNAFQLRPNDGQTQVREDLRVR